MRSAAVAAALVAVTAAVAAAGPAAASPTAHVSPITPAATPTGRAAPGQTRAPLELTAGFDGGGGALSLECPDGCAGVDPSGSIAVHVGLMLDRCTALLYDGWLLGHVSDTVFGDALILSSSHTVALQGWALPRLWLRGGVGLAHLRIRFPDVGTRTENAPVLVGAAGYEAIRWPSMRLDVVLRAGLATFDEDHGQDGPIRSVALGAGLSWY